MYLIATAVVLTVPMSRMAAQSKLAGAAEDLQKAAAASDEAAARAATLFRDLARAKADGDRQPIISALGAMATSPSHIEFEAVARYGSNLDAPAIKETKYPAGADRRSTLAKVIPILISDLEGSLRDPAWRVLIALQPECPAPQRARWEKWWKDRGRALYEAPPPAPGTAEKVTPDVKSK